MNELIKYTYVLSIKRRRQLDELTKNMAKELKLPKYVVGNWIIFQHWIHEKKTFNNLSKTIKLKFWDEFNKTLKKDYTLYDIKEVKDNE